MRLSEGESLLLHQLRQEQKTWPTRRWGIVGAALVVSLVFFYMGDYGDNFWVFMFAILYFERGTHYWKGNPRTILLLRLLEDRLDAEKGSRNAD